MEKKERSGCRASGDRCAQRTYTAAAPITSFFFLNFFAAGGLHIFFGSTPYEIFLSPYTSGAPSAGLLLRRLQNILKNTNHFSGSLGSWVDEERS